LDGLEQDDSAEAHDVEGEVSETPPSDSQEADEPAPDRERARLAGPDQVDNQLRSDREVERSLLDRYQGWKGRLVEEHGFSFGIDYSAVALVADDSPGEEDASGGMVRFFGSWDLVGRESGNTGALVWKVEHRHRIADIPPGDFGFELGFVGLIEPPFSDQGLRLTNFYWRQRFDKGDTTLLGGYVDVTDYVDVYALASPWTGFMNFVFSTGGASIPTPNEGFGVGAGGMVSDKIFVIGGFADTNSYPTDPGETVDSFFNDHEYFMDNAHVTIWQVDEREAAGVPSGWGANVSFTRYIGGRWLPFVRAGYADDGGGLLETTLSTGFGYQRRPADDLLGVGLHWGEPSESSFGPGLSDQFVAEVFYRWQISKEIALTPDLQYIQDPALNPDQSSVWVFGLRARLVL
jgi:porin